MWNLQSKTNEQTAANRSRVMATENKQMAAREWRWGGEGEREVREIKRHKLLAVE